MSGLRGNLDSIKKFSASLRSIPRVVAQKVTEATAPIITTLGLSTFNRGEDAYGNAWAPGVNGDKITLRKTGALADHLRYRATGTRLLAVLAVPYAKYQLGKRQAFPRQGAALPTTYARALVEQAGAAIRGELGGAP